MSALTPLVRSLDAALATDRAGTPCAVHLVAHVSQDHGRLEPVLGQALAAAVRWLDASPTLVAAAGSTASGQVSVLIRFAGGQSALVSAGVCGMGPPLCEAVVFGNRGIVSWEPAGNAFSAAGAQAAGAQAEEAPGAAAETLLAQVRQALHSGRPVAAHGSAGSEPQSDERLTRLVAGLDTPSPNVPPVRPPYGVLLVSGDHTHQPGYAEALASDPRCRLVGLTDEPGLSPRRAALNARLAERLKIPLLPDLAEALARADVHLVSICAEPERRGRIIVQAAAAGKHLYLDKPLAGSPAAAEEIVRAVRQYGVAGHMFSQYYWPPTTEVRQWVADQSLGPLRAVHGMLTFAKGYPGSAKLGVPRRETPLPDAFELPEAKRELTNIGVYPLVTLLALLRRPPRRVFASTANFFFREHQAHDLEDFGQLLLEWEDGLVSTLSVGRTGWRSHPAAGLNRWCLAGAQACATADGSRPHAASWSDREPWQPPPRDPEDPMAMWAALPGSPFAASPKNSWFVAQAAGWSADARPFLDDLEQGRASPVNASLAAAASGVLFGAYRSAAAGAWTNFS